MITVSTNYMSPPYLTRLKKNTILYVQMRKYFSHALRVLEMLSNFKYASTQAFLLSASDSGHTLGYHRPDYCVLSHFLD